jgi:hypothetical protein
MQRCYGAFPDQMSAEGELSLVLHEGPLGLDWAHSGATAEFLADIFGLAAARAGLDPINARHSIAYLANELMENAVKFRAPGLVLIQTRLRETLFELLVTNTIATETGTRFEALLAEMLARDPGELLIERIEANAADPDASGSGLGLLTLLNDYGATLGWSFEAEAAGVVTLRTYAGLPLG